MSKQYVVDSSVIVKWLNTTNEQDLKKANTLLSDAVNGAIELFAPQLSKYEIGNVLLKSKGLLPNEANMSIDALYSLPITFVDESINLAKETFSLAYNHTITYYDASFLALTEALDAILITDNIKHQGKTTKSKVIALKDY